MFRHRFYQIVRSRENYRSEFSPRDRLMEVLYEAVLVLRARVADLRDHVYPEILENKVGKSCLRIVDHFVHVLVYEADVYREIVVCVHEHLAELR